MRLADKSNAIRHPEDRLYFNNDSLQGIVRKRVLPGLLLFDAEKEQLLWWNSKARTILSPEGNYRQILEKIRDHLGKLNKTGVPKVSSKGSFARPLMEALLASKQSRYVMRAFWLDDEPTERLGLLAVLLEQVNPSRFDFHAAQQHFHLSPREFQVVQTLMVGITDKEIASEIGVSPATVRGYMKSIRAKLGVSTRTAVLQKLLSP